MNVMIITEKKNARKISGVKWGAYNIAFLQNLNVIMKKTKVILYTDMNKLSSNNLPTNSNGTRDLFL